MATAMKNRNKIVNYRYNFVEQVKQIIFKLYQNIFNFTHVNLSPFSP